MKPKTYIVDLSAWGLLGVAISLELYAAYLFSTEVAGPLAEGIVGWFR